MVWMVGIIDTICLGEEGKRRRSKRNKRVNCKKRECYKVKVKVVSMVSLDGQKESKIINGGSGIH